MGLNIGNSKVPLKKPYIFLISKFNSIPNFIEFISIKYMNNLQANAICKYLSPIDFRTAIDPPKPTSD